MIQIKSLLLHKSDQFKLHKIVLFHTRYMWLCIDDITRSLHIYRYFFNFKYYFLIQWFIQSSILSRLFGINIFLFTNYNSTKTRLYNNFPIIMGISGCLGCGEAADHTITKNSGLLYPFFFATYMVFFDTFLYYVCLSVLGRRTMGPNIPKLWSIGPKSDLPS